MAGRDLADLQRERGREATVDHCQGTRARARRMCMACARHVHAMCTASPAARCMCYLPQAASWWQTAVRMLGVGSATLVGRADDDTFVVLPRLLAHLQQLGCVRHLCYGPMAYVGYNPATYAKCGWGWAGDGSYYRTYNLQPLAAPCSRVQPLGAPCSPLLPLAAAPQPLYRQLLQVPVRGLWGAAALPLPIRHAAGAQQQRRQQRQQHR